MIEVDLVQYGLAGVALLVIFKTYTLQHDMFRETIRTIDKLRVAIEKLTQEITIMREDINMLKSEKYNEQLIKNLIKLQKRGDSDA